MAQGGVAESLKAEIEGVIERLGLEIVEMTLGSTHLGWTLRILVDRIEGVDLEVCEKVSRALAGIIRSSPEIRDDTVLEVSSAGLNRLLVRESDYDRFQDREAKLRVRGEAGSMTYRGVLKGREGRQVLLLDKGKMRRIPMDDIREGRLLFSFGGKSR